jgi:hypothetical protein
MQNQIEKYKILETIQVGSFGPVFKACHNITNEIVTLKSNEIFLTFDENYDFVNIYIYINI